MFILFLHILSGMALAGLYQLGHDWIYIGYGLHPIACMATAAILVILNLLIAGSNARLQQLSSQ